MNYRSDHMKVLEALSEKPPKSRGLKVAEIAQARFRTRENADRVVRNSMRKPIDEGHVEVLERGLYSLTTDGKRFMSRVESKGYEIEPTRDATERKTIKKATKGKGTKKATKPAKAAKKEKTTTKKAAKPAKATKATKKGSVRARRSSTKEAAPKKNGASVRRRRAPEPEPEQATAPPQEDPSPPVNGAPTEDPMRADLGLTD